MSQEDKDRIAREAARLVETERVESIDRAISLATESLGLGHEDAPGVGRVRQHIRAMSMQALGHEGYEASVRDVLQGAEEIMTLLETTFDDVQTRLVGRAAKGFIDGGVTVHIRLYTERDLGEIADLLVEREYAEPTFETAHTRFGRLDRLRIREEAAEVVLTRCLPAMTGEMMGDLFTGRPLDVIDLAELRRRIEHLRIP